MNIHKNYLYIPLLIFVVIYSVMVLTGKYFLLGPHIIGSTLSLFFLGYLFLDALQIQLSSITEKIFHSLGLSVLLLILMGLAINWTLPLFGNKLPLTQFPILVSFITLTYILLGIGYVRHPNMLTFPSINKLSWVFIGITSTFPFISAIGANRLNNGYGHELTMSVLCIIPIYLFILSIVRKRLSEAVFPISIMTIALTVLFMLSLRSWYISGYDISSEFEVFMFTKNAGYWSIKTFQNAYNACMSITVLPTLLSYITTIPDAYVFKLLYPVLFSITPVVIYFYVKRMSTQVIGYLAAFFFIIQPWFIDPMVTIARQEIAFFFFIILIATLFERSLNLLHKNILVMLYITGLVLSHYSTTYLTNVLFVGTFIVLIFCQFLGKILPIRYPKLVFIKERLTGGNYNLRFAHVLLLFLLTFFWYSQLTGTANNIADFTKKTVSSLHTIFKSEQKAGILNQVALKDPPYYDKNIYKSYYKQKTLEYSGKKDVTLINDPDYKNYELIPRKDKQLPLISQQIYQNTNLVYKVSLISIQLFLGLGFIIFAFYEFWKNKTIPIDYVAFSLVSALLLVAIVVLPNFSLNYNFDRLYLQAMFFLSFVEVLAAYYVYHLISMKRYGFPLAVTHYLVVFLFTFSVFWQITGGKTNVWMNNYGLLYDLTYTHKEETLAADWIHDHYDFFTVYVDGPGRNKLAAYGLLNNINYDFFPSTIGKGSYVFLTHPIVQDKISYLYARGLNIGYEVPIEFLDKNKNRVYDNGGSRVYK